MKSLNIDYICFAGYSHLDWGGVLETLKDLSIKGHKVRVLSGTNIKEYVKNNNLIFEDVNLGYFRPRQPNETIEDTLAYHQFHNFFDTESIEKTYLNSLNLIKENKTDIILSDPLCKTGPLVSIKTGIPYAVLGPYNYQPEGRVEDDNNVAIDKFVKEFSAVTERHGIKDGYKLPLVQNSPWLNIVYSTPDFDKEMCEPNIIHVGSNPFPLKNQARNDKSNVFYSSGTIFWDQYQVDAVVNLAKTHNINLHMTKGKIIPNITAGENIIVYDFCDDKKMLLEMDILITQGGLGTVTNGIRAGKPLLVLPLIWYNQPQAIKTERYGNGLSLKTLDEQIMYLDNTFEKLISNQQFHLQALKLRDNYSSLGGSKKAAELITGLR